MEALPDDDGFRGLARLALEHLAKAEADVDTIDAVAAEIAARLASELHRDRDLRVRERLAATITCVWALGELSAGSDADSNAAERKLLANNRLIEMEPHAVVAAVDFLAKSGDAGIVALALLFLAMAFHNGEKGGRRRRARLTSKSPVI